MKFIFLASFLVLIVFPCLTDAIEKGEKVILKRKRNGEYYIYQSASFYGQDGSTVNLRPPGYSRYTGFKRKDVIINIPPLEGEVMPGVNVLAKIARDKFSRDIYSPVKALNESNGDYLVKPVCENKAPPLGVADDFVYTKIPDKAFTASSHWFVWLPHQARLNKDLTWCAGNKDKEKPWLQVDLQKNCYICSVTTNMLVSGKKAAVTAFALAVSQDGKAWHHVMENNERKIFKRDFPVNVVTHFVNLVDKPYRYIRFYSLRYYSHPCLAVEVNGYGRVRLPPYKLRIDDLRIEGSVCKLQNDCVKKKNAECNEEGKILDTYNCRCKSGFQGLGWRDVFDLNEKDFPCSDIDECRDNACGTFATCTNIPGSYKCNCKKGFQHPNGSVLICKDIDECSNSPCSPQARCTNTDGSFNCQCEYGFQGNGYKCVDIDECNLDDGTSKCKSKYSVCTNSPGSYKCTCQTGFTGDGNTCTDINECSSDPHPCKSMNAKCSNNIGSYTCHCFIGHQLEAGICQEIDECSNPDWNDCNQHAKCTNKPGSYSCDCKGGFTGSGYDDFGCSDIDECLEKSKCGSHSRCENSEGSFTCTCDNGYTSHNGRSCSDIDECKTGKAHCHHHATCKNLPGSFACLCPPGFTGKGDVVDGCTALSWCKWKGHVKCNKELRHCGNRLKKCTDCMSGYEEKNGVCQDINECEKNSCGKSVSCVNTPGSFKCHCGQKGYVFNSKTLNCEDIDECSSNKHHCHGNAVCENTPGSYRCKCKKGFDGDGIYCADTNECYIDNYTCPENSACSNTLGSYKCTCKMGYHQSEDKCKEDGTSKNTTPKKNSKGNSLFDLSFLWSSGSTLTSQAVWKLLFLSATLIFARSFLFHFF